MLGTAVDDGLDIVLTEGSARTPGLLQAPSQAHFGGSGEPNLQWGHIRIRVGKRPTVRNLKSMFKSTGRRVPERFEVFWNHEIWLLNHSVSVIREGRYEEIESLIFSSAFADERVSVIEVLPQRRFVVSEGAASKCEADVRLNGRAHVPDPEARLIPVPINLCAGARLDLGEDELVGRVSMYLMTPEVQAAGAGDCVGHWVLDRPPDSALEGYQPLIHILLADKYVERLDYQVQVKASVRGLNGLPLLLQSKSLPFAVDLHID